MVPGENFYYMRIIKLQCRLFIIKYVHYFHHVYSKYPFSSTIKTKYKKKERNRLGRHSEFH